MEGSEERSPVLDVPVGDAETDGEEGFQSSNDGEPEVLGDTEEAIHPVWHPGDPVQGVDEFIDPEPSEDDDEANREGEAGVLGGGHALRLS